MMASMFRLPAFSHGISAFVWAVVFGVYIWIAGAAFGFSGATTFVIGIVAAAGIFLYIRIYGEDDPNRP